MSTTYSWQKKSHKGLFKFLFILLMLVGVFTCGVIYGPTLKFKYTEIKTRIFGIEEVQISDYKGTYEVPGGFSRLSPTMQKLVVLFEQEQIPIKITSGYRSNNTGSYHIEGKAIDVIPSYGDFNYLRYCLKTNHKIRAFMIGNHIGVLEEIDKETMNNTHATGKHFHIGPDNQALKFWSEFNYKN